MASSSISINTEPNGNNGSPTSSITKLISKKKKEASLIQDVSEHISTVVHTTVIGFVGYILYLCCKDDVEWTLLTWHVFLYTLGWALFMTEGMLMLTKENIYSKRISHWLRVQFHWIVECLAAVFSLAGFLCIYISKEDSGSDHFQSDHSLYGLISIIFCAPTCLNGLTALFSVELKNLIRPSIHKLFHAVCGIVTLIIGGVSMILSLYTGWYVRKTNASDFAFYVGFVILASSFVWCILRPILNSLSRLKSLIF